MLYPRGDDCWVSVVIAGTGFFWWIWLASFKFGGTLCCRKLCQIGLHSSVFDSGQEGGTVLQWKTLQLSLFLIMTSACNLHATQTKKHANRQGDKIKENTVQQGFREQIYGEKRKCKLHVDPVLCACHIQQHARWDMNCSHNLSWVFQKTALWCHFPLSSTNHLIKLNDEHSTS